MNKQINVLCLTDSHQQSSLRHQRRQFTATVGTGKALTSMSVHRRTLNAIQTRHGVNSAAILRSKDQSQLQGAKISSANFITAHKAINCSTVTLKYST